MLREAASELAFLRMRGYALPSALKLVGDRHQLRERQRKALARVTSEAATAASRRGRRVPLDAAAPRAVHIDGFNAVIICESAINGGVLLASLDGCLRDIAGIHGSWRPGPATERALALLALRLSERGWRHIPTSWLLDAPVSNSGRLASMLRALARSGDLPWSVEVVADPDACLRHVDPGTVVASADAAILDACPAWIDLAGETIAKHVPDAWVIDLASGTGEIGGPGAGSAG